MFYKFQLTRRSPGKTLFLQKGLKLRKLFFPYGEANAVELFVFFIKKTVNFQLS